MRYAAMVLVFVLVFPALAAGQTTIPDNPIYCGTELKAAAQAYNAGLDADSRGDVETAMKRYHEAIELDEGYCDAMDNLGRLYRTQEKYDKAIELYARSIALNGKNPVSRQNLGVVYLVQGNAEKGIEQFKAIIDIDPDNPEGHYSLGNLFINFDEPAKAIPYLEKAEALYTAQSSPYTDDARIMLALAHTQLAQCKKAIAWSDKLGLAHRQQETYRYIVESCGSKK